MSYLIKKNKATSQIVYMEYNMNGYEFKPKKVEISKIMIINPTLIEKILTIKFNQMFKKLALYVYQLLNSDNNDETAEAYCLGEVERLKSILFLDYQKYISKEKQKMFETKLAMIEQQLKAKMMLQMGYFNQVMEEPELDQGRGR